MQIPQTASITSWPVVCHPSVESGATRIIANVCMMQTRMSHLWFLIRLLHSTWWSNQPRFGWWPVVHLLFRLGMKWVLSMRTRFPTLQSKWMRWHQSSVVSVSFFPCAPLSKLRRHLRCSCSFFGGVFCCSAFRLAFLARNQATLSSVFIADPFVSSQLVLSCLSSVACSRKLVVLMVWHTERVWFHSVDKAKCASWLVMLSQLVMPPGSSVRNVTLISI